MNFGYNIKRILLISLLVGCFSFLLVGTGYFLHHESVEAQRYRDECLFGVGDTVKISIADYEGQVLYVIPGNDFNYPRYYVRYVDSLGGIQEKYFDEFELKKVER